MKHDFEAEMIKREKELWEEFKEKCGYRELLILFSPHLTTILISVVLFIPYRLISAPLLIYFGYTWYSNRKALKRKE